MRRAEILMHHELAGWLSQDENGYHFQYTPSYLQSKDPKPISLTLPIQEKPFTNNVLFSFFDGLIPEGWLLDIAEKNWKLHPRDRMGLLLACCKDCIGAVSIHVINESEV
jgi:serine/threonine-protein kinase HipA